jgi:hypothetical protein
MGSRALAKGTESGEHSASKTKRMTPHDQTSAVKPSYLYREGRGEQTSEKCAWAAPFVREYLEGHVVRRSTRRMQQRRRGEPALPSLRPPFGPVHP